MRKKDLVMKMTALALLAVLLTGCVAAPPETTGQTQNTTARPTESAAAPTVSTTVPTTAGVLELVLQGDPAMILEYGDTFADPGILVYWNGHPVAADIKTEAPSFDKTGEHRVIYHASYQGVTAQLERAVEVVDTRAPEITLNGADSVTISTGDQFSDPGCTAVDLLDGDITSSIVVNGRYDQYQPGTYTITYTARDSHGNAAQVTRTLIVEGQIQPDIVEPNGKVIYLTFDDGPSKHTPRLLKVLEKYNVKATFFVVGNASLEYLDDIVDGGHAIAIHTNSHEYSKIYATEEAFFKDFNAIRNKIHDRTGIWTTLCRFPGGSSNRVSKKYCTGIMTKLTQAVEAQGYQYFDWNVDSNDAGGAKTADEVFANVIKGVKGNKYSIVLQHDIHGFSVDAVERIIQWGLANGYTFLALDPTSPNAHHDVRN